LTEDMAGDKNGLIFSDKYEIIRRIAMGGMGEIFLARQRGIAGFDRLAIIKTLLPELAEQQSFLDQFLDEARVAATLNHPNIVAIYDVGQWAGVYFIAMEYINGDDLSGIQRAAAKTRTSIPFRVSAAIIRDAALGLDHAHAASDANGKPLSIVHRDISPQNIMVRGDGVTKVVDFGIAKAANRSSRTQTGTLKGKLRYMSPEQVQGQEMDGRSDQFALGLTLWKLCLGRDLFEAETPIETFKKILFEPIPQPSSVIKGFPPALESIILKSLAKEPKDRYPRCAEMAVALRNYVDSIPATAENDVPGFVQLLVGEQLAERVRDLTPQAVAIQGLNLESLGAKCPRCGHVETSKKKFCSDCGANMGGESAAPIPDESAPTIHDQTMPALSAHDSVPPGMVQPVGAARVRTQEATRPGTGSLTRPRTGEFRRSPSGSVPAPGYTPTGVKAPTPHSNPGLVVQAPTRGEGAVVGGLPGNLGGYMAELPSLLGQEKRNVTVLRASFQGFGALRGKMEAEAYVALTDNVVNAMSDIAAQYEASVDQMTEESMLLVFGVPQTHEDDPERAVRCALDMVTACGSFSANLEVKLTLKGGIASGMAVTAGASQRRAGRSVSGDPVDHAGKLEAAAAAGKFLCTVATQRVLKGKAVFGTTPVTVGKEDGRPVEAVEVRGLVDEKDAPTTILLGRDVELEEVRYALAMAVGGTPQAMLFVSEPGMGKTRLLSEVGSLASVHGMLVGRGSGGRWGNAAHLDVLRQVFTWLALGLATSNKDPSGQANPLTQSGLVAVFARLGLPDHHVKRLNHLFANGPPPSGFDATDSKLLNDAAICAALERMAAEMPVCILVDDAQTGDPGSLELLAEIPARLPTARIAVVAAARAGIPDTVLPGVSRRELGRLADADLLLAAQQALGGDALPAVAAELVRQRAGGNPSLGRQLVQALIDGNGLQRLGNKWHATPNLSKLNLGSTLGLVLGGRVDKLPPHAQLLMRTAAVAGQVFLLDVVKDALGGAVDVTDATNACMAVGFIEMVDRATGSWGFVQGAMQEVILGRLLKTDLKRINLQLAEAMEKRAAAGKYTPVEAMAAHFLAAEVPAKAAHYTAMAADLLQQQGAVKAAAASYHKALELARAQIPAGKSPTDQQAGQVYQLIGRATSCMALSDPDEATKLLPPWTDVITPSLAPHDRVEALRQRAMAFLKLSKVHDAEACLAEATQLCNAKADPELSATIMGDRAAVLEAKGELETATQQLVQCFQVMQGKATKNPDFYWEHLNRLGRVHLRLRQAARAKEFFTHARDQAQRAQSLVGESKAVTNLAGVAAGEGKSDEAIKLFGDALDLASRAGDQVGVARVHYNAGRLLLSMGRRDQASQRLQTALDVARAVGWREGIASATQTLDAMKRGGTQGPQARPGGSGAR
jgi:serine/threonine protein kinase/class 3 adenylate cyclase/tetratricopeptide (TPR) repeat protein